MDKYFAGVVYREDTNQILCIQDRLMKKYLWKFPGGAGRFFNEKKYFAS